MATFATIVAILIAAVFLRVDLRSFSSELPVFIDRYKQSAVYWSSALLGAWIGSTKFVSSQLNGVVLTVIFFGPLVGYFVYYRPFGLSCVYRPVDRERSVVDALREDEKILEIDPDGYAFADLRVSAGSHYDEYGLKFIPPEGLVIDYVDYECPIVENFDDGTLHVKSDGRDNFSITVVLVTVPEPTSDHPIFQVQEASSGRVLEELTVH